ncbi:CD1375 family protein [Ruminiclostridium herbifermentans]|nr:CD1375 family protein [Ruminiclostridium herbifermentans]
MAKIYYDLIKSGLRTINDVPEKWRSKVQVLLDLDVKSE